MKIPYRILEDHYVEASKLHDRRLWWPLLLIMVSTVMVMWFSAGKFPLTYWAAAFCLAVSIVALIFQYLIMPWSLRRQYREWRAQDREFSVELQEDGICFTFPEGKRQVPWNAITHWRRGQRCILIYLSSTVFMVVPILTQDTGGDMAPLLEALTEYVGKPA